MRSLRSWLRLFGSRSQYQISLRNPAALLNPLARHSHNRSARHAPALGLSVRQFWSHHGGEHRNYDEPLNWANGLAVILALLMVSAPSRTAACEDKNDRVADATAKLRPKLAEVRKKIREEYRLPDYVQDRKVSISMSPEGTLCISFSLPETAPIISTLVTFTKSLNRPEMRLDTRNGIDVLGVTFAEANSSVLIKSPQSGKRGEFMYFKDGKITSDEIDAIVKAYEENVRNSVEGSTKSSALQDFFNLPTEGFVQEFPGRSTPSKSAGPQEQLIQLGAKVYMPNERSGEEQLTWDSLAGYESVKRDIEDTILLAVKHPDEYDLITRGTRMVYEKNKIRAVLFEGPPGCGKTTTARILSSIAEMPMVYVPIEAVMSKFYGESENRLSDIFKACERLGTCFVFLDEIDSLATSRDSGNMHEATRRVLSVLLRSLDGFEKNSNSIVIAATNRKADLDAALISRFNLTINFGLPDFQTRTEIFRRYAKQLSEEELQDLAREAHNFSGRDIKDICELAERRWASKRIRRVKEAQDLPTPNLHEYQKAILSKTLQEDWSSAAL